MRRILLPLLLFLATGRLWSASGPAEWQVLFNGHDLSGWINVNCAPNTFTVSDGLIVSTGVPTGILRTDRQYENFEIELEWRHMKAGGNAGLFVWAAPLTAPGTPFARAIEVQVLDGRNSENYTSHGDLFAIHGATFKPDWPHPAGWMRCLPSEHRCRPAGEWNHYQVSCSNGVIKLAVNGKVVSGGSESKPRKGYICLESEGSECHFRNIRVREFPSSHPPSAEIAPLAERFRNLYTGIDLTGWKLSSAQVAHWTAKDWTLAYDGRSSSTNQPVWTTAEFGDAVIIVDWRLTRAPANRQRPLIQPNGDYALQADGTPQMVDVSDAGESGLYVRGSTQAKIHIWSWPIGSGELWNYRTDPKQPPALRAAATPTKKGDMAPGQWNRFLITLKGDQVSIELNGQLVIDRAQLPGLPRRGPLGLHCGGDPIEFANLFVKELD